MGWGKLSANKDGLRVAKVNSQPEVESEVAVWASLPTAPSQPASLSNLQYWAVSSQPFTTELLDRTFYSGTKNSAVDGMNHKSTFATDDIVDHSQVTGNYRSKPGDSKPWIEIALTEPVVVAGLEVTTFGAEDNKRFRNIVFRAGLTQSPVSGANAGGSLLDHNPFEYKYTSTASAGEVVYIIFKYPVIFLTVFYSSNTYINV